MVANPRKVAAMHQENAPKKPPMKAADSVAMLSTCRDLAADLLSKSLTAMLDKIEDSLFKLAEDATDRDKQNLYLQARGEAQSKRSSIEVEFRRQFVEGFNRMMRGEKTEKKGFDQLDPDSLELSLVGEEDYEENLAASNLATRLKHAGGDELLALNQRIGALMSLPDADSVDNPMSPQAIVEAFRAACKRIESDLNVRLLVLKQFEQVAGDNVSTVFHDVNKFLIQRNILPVLPKAAVRRRPGGSSPNNRAGSFGSAEQAVPGGSGGAGYGEAAYAAAGFPGMAPGMAAGFGPAASSDGGEVPAYAVGNEQELINALQQLLAFNQAMQMPFDGLGGMAGGGEAAAPIPTLGGGNGNLGQNFLDALNLMQQGKPIEALSDVGELDLTAIINGQANFLHQLKSTNLGKSLGQLDALTVDIVALLFDYIFDDKNIPGPMKALIGRLQIPVLKVAMLDNKFFARKNHPTRKLLDSLSVAALGWQEADGLDDRLYRKIAELVERIVAGFDENIALFETVLAELEIFQQEEERRASEAAAQKSSSLAQDEQRELAAAMASQVITERLLVPDLPEIIRNFLVEQWQPVLIHVVLLPENADEAWRNTVQAADDLIWSVLPKVGVEERLRLVNMLPKLLKQLEQGTQDAGVERSRREAFFTDLVQAHAQAIKSGLKVAMPAASVSAARKPASGTEPTLLATSPERSASPKVSSNSSPNSSPDTSPNALPNTSVNVAPVEALPRPVLPEPVKILPSQVLGATAPVSHGLLGDLPPMDMEVPLTAFEVNNPAWDSGLDKYLDYDDVVASQLKRGSWVEFRQADGECTRAKLAWISPRKSRFLFTNRQGQNGAEYTLAALIALFKNGEAQIIEGGPLVERAVSDMIDLLQPATTA